MDNTMTTQELKVIVIEKVNKLCNAVDPYIRTDLVNLINILNNPNPHRDATDTIPKVVINALPQLILRLCDVITNRKDFTERKIEKKWFTDEKGTRFRIYDQNDVSVYVNNLTWECKIDNEIADRLLDINRMANGIDHNGQKISVTENEAYVCVDRFLEALHWYYCESPKNPKTEPSIYRLSEDLEILQSFKNKSNEITNGTLNDLIGMGYGKYLKDKFIMPAAWDRILNKFFDDNETSVIVITAKTGYGKSCFLCKKAEQLIEQDAIVLFWHHDNVPYPDYDKFISSLMVQNGGKAKSLDKFADIIGHLQKGSKQITILIDGLNEHGNYVDAFRRIINCHNKLIEIAPHNVKLVLSIREKTSDLIEQDIEHLNQGKSLFCKPDGKSAIVAMPSYTDSESADIISKYMGSGATGVKFSKIASHLKKLLKIPLMTRLYAEAVRDGQVNHLAVSRKSLWESYFNRAGSEVIGQNAFVSSLTMGQLIISAAEHRFAHPSNDIPLRRFIEKESKKRANVEECYSQLCKEGYFIQHKNKQSFSFCYEDFLEHVLSQDVLPKYYEAKGIEDLCKVLEDKGHEHQWLTNAFGEFLFNLLLSKELKKDDTAIQEVLNIVLQKSGDACARGLVHLYFLLGASTEFKDIADRMLDALVANGQAEITGKIFQLISSETTDELATSRVRKICESYLKYQVGRRNALGAADALIWMSDKYFYNRLDDYANAIMGMKEACRILFKTGHSDLTWNRANLFLAHVYSDAGKTDEAWELIEQSLRFFENQEKGLIDIKKGYATSLYYKYMIKGDASGYFSKEVVSNLDVARQLFEETGEKRFEARCMINRAIANLHLEQDTRGMDKQDFAIEMCTQAITKCEETGDYQGRAYALINRASFAIQKAGFISTEGKLIAQKINIPEPENTLIDMVNYVNNALNDLAEVANFYETSGEKYLTALAYANLASIAQVMKNNQLATTLIDKVIEINMKENPECCDDCEDDTDFYNQFDAEITKAYYKGDSCAIVNHYSPLADKKKYEQGILRGLWYLWKLSENQEETCKYEKQALQTASKLGWGNDPRQSIYSPWYAGIFLQHDLRIRINDQKGIESIAQPLECEEGSFTALANFLSEEFRDDSENDETADISPSELTLQFDNDLSIVCNDWEKFAASRLNQEVPSVGMEDEDRKEAVEETERDDKGISGSRKRVYELAKEVGLEIKELITRLEKIGISVKSHTSPLSDVDIEKIQAEILSSEPSEVVNQRIKRTIIRRRAIRTYSDETAVVPVRDQLPVQYRIDELQNSKEPSNVGNSVQTEKPVWNWRSGQISRAFEEWLIQAQLEENRSQAIESIKDGKLEHWLKSLDESEYKQYVKEKNVIEGLFCRDVYGDTIKEKVREKGRVKWFNEEKGYGFITRELGGKIFVHYSNIVEDGFPTLCKGKIVEFEVVEGKKGSEAINVTTKYRTAPKK